MSLTNRYVALLLAVPVALALSACSEDSNGEGTGNGGNGANGGNGSNGGNEGNGGNEENFTTDLQLGTASVNDIDAPMGEEYASIFEDNINVEDFSVTAQETGTSVENLASLEVGNLQLALAHNHSAVGAVNGEGQFEGAALEDAALMGQLYPEVVHIVTLEGNDIDSVADLEGKTIAVGPGGSGTEQIAEQVLSAAGLEDGDYEPFVPEGDEYPDTMTELQDGNIDASVETLGVPGENLEQLAADTGEATLIPLETEQVQAATENDAVQEHEISADAYDFLDEPITSVSVFAGMYGSMSEVSEDLGYEITKAMYENSGELTSAPDEMLEPEDALQGRADLPLHPGAERYFEEVGAL